MTEESGAAPVERTTGWAVLHLFCRVTPTGSATASDSASGTSDTSRETTPRAHARTDRSGVLGAIETARKDDHQVVTAAMVGHKADVCILGLGPDIRVLRRLQTGVSAAGLEVVDSYVSLTEVSEYAAGVPDALKQARLYPVLPPDGMPAFCFYPMSKRRSPGAENWYTLAFEQRLRLMQSHGAVGREFRGRVLQLVTGSTGLDDHEWGVTLFGTQLSDLKECVYQMRFDEGSAKYADFGRFYTGTIGDAAQVLDVVGIGS